MGRFTDAQILDMRTQYRDGILQKTIAIQYGIKQVMISCIVAGRYYSNAPWPLPLLSSQDRRSLPEFPNYEFDKEGNAYSFKYNKRYGRQINPRLHDRGYLMIAMFNSKGKYRNLRINRIICTLFNGPPPTPKHQARHLNGIKTDNRAMNLAWGTQSENELDKIKHGTNPVGEKAGSSKLTESIVKEIRISEQSQRKLAQRYGVSQPAIFKIIHRETWKHI